LEGRFEDTADRGLLGEHLLPCKTVNIRQVSVRPLRPRASL